MGVEATSGDMMIGWDDSDDLHLGVLSNPNDTTIATKMLISASGNVGIGTTSPSHKLSVSGSIYASGTISASGDLSIAGDNVDFNNLPSSSYGVHLGGLYKQTGAQLGLSIPGSGSLNFVLIK
jgi:hypothetical protein